jgi:F420-dependent oxidoreductase-like protein
MKVGLHISNFTWDDGPAELRFRLAEIAQRAEQSGVDRISVMDHVWQIGPIGPPDHEMLEAYTALGWLAAKTEQVKLLTMVTAVVYREPGLLAKAMSTLDVLSGGRSILGIGAAWNEDESRGLGLPFPPTAERFERLEEAIRICLQMWSDDDGPFEGKHYHLARTLNSPQPLTRPRPPLLIGGGGEKKTLRLVAQYADSCNIAFYNPDEAAHKLDVLRQHCADVGRDYDEIEKTAQTRFDLGENGEHIQRTIEQLHHASELGFTVAHGSLLGVSKARQQDFFLERIIPALEKF